ncbi:MAG TPA: DUF4097 family beta strand repeat-containing protein [Thermoanaerobaculia bacterium]|jgi:DUF4097 and DUF4098 domain-containing protein YvlB
MRRSTGLALAFTLTVASSAFGADDIIRKGFNVADGGTLRLDAGIGRIKVVAGGTGVAIEVVREADGRDGEETMREHKISFRQEGNDVIVTSDFDRKQRWFNWFDDYEVQWNIRVPARYNIDVKTSGGSIELANLGGTVNARTSGGSISAGKLSGVSTLKTSGGSIKVEGATASLVAKTSGGSIRIGDTTGPVEARTSGGSITLARTGGPVVAHTSGGGIRIEGAMGRVDASTSGGSIYAEILRQPSGDSRLATSGGGVTVLLASGIGVDLDARASGGGVHADVPVTIIGRQDDDHISGKVNGGGPKLVLRTSGGGVRVKPM